MTTFPKKSSYWFRELIGTLRLTRCGLLPLIGKVQASVRTWVGYDELEEANFQLRGLALRIERAMQDGIDGCVEQINGLRADVDADQSEYATNRAEDLKRLDELEANVQTLARQGAQLVNALNTATMLCAAWREVPLLKAAEAKAKAQAEFRKQARDERTAEILKGASKNGTGVTVIEKPEGD